MRVTYRNTKTKERVVVDPRSPEAVRLARSKSVVREEEGSAAGADASTGGRGSRRNARAVAGTATGTAAATEPATE